MKMTFPHLLDNLSGLKIVAQANLKEPSAHIIHAILRLAETEGIEETRVRGPGEPVSFDRVKNYLEEALEQLSALNFSGAAQLAARLIVDLERCGIKGKIPL